MIFVLRINFKAFLSDSVFDSAYWLSVKTCLEVRKSKFKIIFALSLRSLAISQFNMGY